MRKILELVFCLVALVALLVFTKNAENVEDVENGEALIATSSDIQNSVAGNVAMFDCQK